MLTDADVLFRKDTLAQLVARFEDQSIGAISGKIVINNAHESSPRNSRGLTGTF